MEDEHMFVTARKDYLGNTIGSPTSTYIDIYDDYENTKGKKT